MIYPQFFRRNQKIVTLMMAISTLTFAESVDECQALASKFKGTKSVKIYTSSVTEIAQCYMSHNQYAKASCGI